MAAILLAALMVMAPCGGVYSGTPGDGEVQTITTCRTMGGGDSKVVICTTPGGVGADGQMRVYTAICQAEGDGAGRIQFVPAGAGGEDEHRQMIVMASADEGAPAAWLGVRLSPVPAPLGAHIGKDGVMILNVVKGSPADEAGLEQYDVIVKFDGEAIASPKDLTDKLAGFEPGGVAKLEVIRAGQPEPVKIRPGERPKDLGLEMKYEEAEDALLDDVMKMRGRVLRLGPGQEWTIEDLGELQGLPDALRELESLNLDFDFDVHLDGQVPWMDEDSQMFFMSPGRGHAFFGQPDGEANFVITIKRSEDGESVTIRSEGDGKIHVERVDAEGNETSAEYESVEELEEADPDAFEIYSKHAAAGGPGRAFVHVQPFGDRARELRWEYQIDVQEKIEEALERAKEAQQKAVRERERAMEAYEQAREGHQGWAEPKARRRVEVKALSTAGEVLATRVEESGRVVVVVRGADGEVERYTFADMEALQTAEPELYERVKGMMEGRGED